MERVWSHAVKMNTRMQNGAGAGSARGDCGWMVVCQPLSSPQMDPDISRDWDLCEASRTELQSTKAGKFLALVAMRSGIALLKIHGNKLSKVWMACWDDLLIYQLDERERQDGCSVRRVNCTTKKQLNMSVYTI